MQAQGQVNVNFDESILSLLTPELDPLFWRPIRHCTQSAWHGHIPFAHWVIRAGKPRLLVELGTHTGVSYSAFCQAVVNAQLTTRCFAVDSWQGDEHAGYYGEEVFTELEAFHRNYFGAFSSLLRCSFDDALAYFPDASVDLLHIDGQHSYARVRHDFETWRTKLSDRAVVLFHDTNVREREFGVWQLWTELNEQYPSFEFTHAHGLGVLAIGQTIAEPILALCNTRDMLGMRRVRERFALIGERWQLGAELSRRISELQRAQETTAARQQVAQVHQRDLNHEIAQLRADLHSANHRIAQFDAEVRRLMDHSEQAIGALHLTETNRRELEAALRRAETDVALCSEREADLHAKLAHAQDELQAVLRSTSWRATAFLRKTVGRFRTPQASFAPSTLEVPSGDASSAGGGHLSAPRKLLSREPQFRFRRVLFVSGEPGTPGHVYRVVRYAEAAQSVGWSARVMSLAELNEQAIASVDVLILWRCDWRPEIDLVLHWANRANVAVVYDIDDLMFKPELATKEVVDGIRSQGLTPRMVSEHYERVQKVLLRAHASTCTTSELARHIRDFDKTAYILPNGFDAGTLATSRLAVRWRSKQPDDGIVRIGYASGTQTHQRDFLPVASAIAQLLHDRPHCRLVLFRDGSRLLLDSDEYPELVDVEAQIEWREKVSLSRLPDELVRFDISIAPLEVGNLYCEAKSELKYFEAALVNVPTVASPTGPMCRAIRNGETGLFATTTEDWYSALSRLVDDVPLRRRIAHSAYLDALWRYGPERRQALMQSALEQIAGSSEGARAFELELFRNRPTLPPEFDIPASEVKFASDAMRVAEVTVVVPSYNYAQYLEEALESVHAQTLTLLDLIIVDDASTDSSLELAIFWATRNAERFNRLLVMRNKCNSGLARTRNVGIDAAETTFVLPLDADNRLLPGCCERLLEAARRSRAGFAYPMIQLFGDSKYVLGTERYTPMRLAGSNYIDAMALIAKWAWAAVGGFKHIQYGWEDYDFWCCCAEHGIWGEQVAEILAEYRFHKNSMLRTVTDRAENKCRLIRDMEAQHGWLTISRRQDDSDR